MSDDRFPHEIAAHPPIKPDGEIEPDIPIIVHPAFDSDPKLGWLRGGGCRSGCGACCQDMLLELHVDPEWKGVEDWAKWLKLHGVTLIEREGRYFGHIAQPCSALNQEDGRCTLYGTPDRPEMCSNFPEHPITLAGLEKVCSYKFVPLDFVQDVMKRRRERSKLQEDAHDNEQPGGDAPAGSAEKDA